MEITEVRIKLMDDGSERLQAFCSITFDNCFVIRDLKIIEGTNGPFVAMPSRKLTAHCAKCGCKNHLRASYCNQCGSRQPDDRAVKEADGRVKLYADIAHPINSDCREMIQNRVIQEFETERERSQDPEYVSRYDDFDGGDYMEEIQFPSETWGNRADGESRRVDQPAAQAGAKHTQGPHRGGPKKDTSSAPASQKPKKAGGFGDGLFD